MYCQKSITAPCFRNHVPIENWLWFSNVRKNEIDYGLTFSKLIWCEAGFCLRFMLTMWLAVVKTTLFTYNIVCWWYNVIGSISHSACRNIFFLSARYNLENFYIAGIDCNWSVRRRCRHRRRYSNETRRCQSKCVFVVNFVNRLELLCLQRVHRHCQHEKNTTFCTRKLVSCSVKLIDGGSAPSPFLPSPRVGGRVWGRGVCLLAAVWRHWVSRVSATHFDTFDVFFDTFDTSRCHSHWHFNNLCRIIFNNLFRDIGYSHYF